MHVLRHLLTVLECHLERCRPTQGRRALIRQETADATKQHVTLAVHAHTPSTRMPSAATTKKTFIIRTIVSRNSGISLSKVIGTAAYSLSIAQA